MLTQQRRSTFSQSNSSRFLGTTGLNLLDLRGLGTQRTLVLVNGRRHVADQALLELGDPRDAFNWSADLKRGALTVGYVLRYIGKMVLNEYEDFFSVQGRPPQNADYADRRYYPSVVYHDVRASYDFSDTLHAYLGVDNVADKVPPLGLTGAGEGSGIYETRGRFFYAGTKYNFGGR